MHELGPALPFHVIAVYWLAKVVVLVLACSLLAIFGVGLIDVLIPKIPKRERVGEHPLSVGLFIAGLFVFMGLVIHGALSTPVAVGAPLLEAIIDLRRLGLMAACFFVSLLLGVALFYVADRLTPTIPFLTIEKSPLAVGVCVFSYLVFFGLIIHAALIAPF